jgi:inosose dehydratase
MTSGEERAMTSSADTRSTTDRIRLAAHSITWNIPRGDQFEPWLDEVVRAGYDGVALFTMQVEDFIGQPDRLKDMLDERGLGLAAVTGFVDDDPAWAETVMSFMQHLGVRHLACTDFDTVLTIPRAADILNERGRCSKRYDVNVYYHNHTGGVGETMTEVEALMELLDPSLVHFMLDVGHATKDFPELPPRERAADFLERHWAQIDYLELKDWNETTDLNTPLGEGYADFDRILALVRDRGYDGEWLTIEQNGNLGPSLGRTPLESATISRRFLANHGL